MRYPIFSSPGSSLTGTEPFPTGPFIANRRFRDDSGHLRRYDNVSQLSGLSGLETPEPTEPMNWIQRMVARFRAWYMMNAPANTVDIAVIGLVIFVVIIVCVVFGR